jgi:hypothetical protein
LIFRIQWSFIAAPAYAGVWGRATNYFRCKINLTKSSHEVQSKEFIASIKNIKTLLLLLATARANILSRTKPIPHMVSRKSSLLYVLAIASILLSLP